MSTQAWIVMTQEQRDAAEALNDMDANLGSQEIVNPIADNLDLKDSLGVTTVIGMWVATVRVLNDEAYVRWVPTLGTLPIRTIDSETIFAPPGPI